MLRRALVVAVCGVVAGCTPSIRRCAEGCPEGSSCHEASGLCVESVAADAGHDAGSDAGVVDAGVDAGSVDASVDAGDVDSGVDDGGTDAGCDIATNSGCPANLRCGLFRADSDAGLERDGRLECMPRGSQGNGDACSFTRTTGGSVDDCDSTLLCAAFSGDGCRKTCALDNPNCAAGLECSLYDFGPGVINLGLCIPMCDPVSQKLLSNGSTCGSGRGCYGRPQGAGFCSRELAPGNVHGTVLTGIPYLNACAAGAAPFNFDAGSVCTALCRPAEVHAGQTVNAGGIPPYTCASRGAPNAACRFWAFYAPELVGTPGLNDYGYCSDPAFEDVPPCTALDAGDHLSYGCGPL